MRRIAIALSCLLPSAPLLAAPVPAGTTTPAAAPVTQVQFHTAVHEYVQNLSQVMTTVEQGYVRPANRADLIEAALTGLYEVAQVPAPAGLKAAVKKAKEDNALDALLVKTRTDLGNPEVLQGRKALIASCRAMMRSLDPYCAVLTGEEAALTTGFDQNFGLGIDLVQKSGTGPLMIKAVVPGGPAQRAGLQAGDHITRVDDKDTNDLNTERALQLLNGGGAVMPIDIIPPPRAPGGMIDPGTPDGSVRLTVRAAGSKTERKVTLTRESFEPETVHGVIRNEDNSWDYWVDRKKGIAQVRIVGLAQHTDQELARVLARLEGGPGLRGLILDLRWCPGGFLRPSIAAAGMFLEKGVVAKTKARLEGEQVYQAEGAAAEKFLGFPIVVLVNAETSGGGELIAAALQDHQRAVVAGQRTRGKASIQNQTPVYLPSLDGRNAGPLQLKLTSGTFLRPSGKGLNRFADSKSSDDWGVRPDPKLECPVSPELGRQLKEWWREQSLRPGASSKALPLDDPETDPQRQAALKALVRIMGEKK